MVEINQTLIKSLVDINVSMLVMVASVVRELGIMHLVLGQATYIITLRTIIQAWEGSLMFLSPMARWFGK